MGMFVYSRLNILGSGNDRASNKYLNLKFV
jgi:hypothetical protein